MLTRVMKPSEKCRWRVSSCLELLSPSYTDYSIVFYTANSLPVPLSFGLSLANRRSSPSLLASLSQVATFPEVSLIEIE